MVTLRSCVVGVVAVLLVGTSWTDAAAQDPPNLQALWDDPDTEVIIFNFNQNAQDPLCADPNGYCAAWVPSASQECKDNYRFGTDDQATVTRLAYEQCVYEMIFRPFLSQTAPRGVPTLSAGAIETAARLQAAGWDSPRALGNPDLVATSDVPDILVNDAREALIIAHESLGRYGPLRAYIVGNDVFVVEPVINDFCNWSYEATSANNLKCPGNEGQGESIREMAYIYPGGNAFAQHGWNRDPPTQALVLNPASDENNQFEAVNNPKRRLDEKVIAVHEYFHIYQNAHVIYRTGDGSTSAWSGVEGYRIPSWLEESNAVYFSWVIGDQRAWDVDLLSRIDEQVDSVAEFRSRFPALSIVDIETEASRARVQAYCGTLCVGQLQYEHALLATKLLVHKSSDNTLFFDFYQDLTTMGWAAAFEKAFGLSVETFYQELEAFLQQPLAVQKTQLRNPPTPTPTPTVGAGQLLPGGSLSSPGGQYRLVYQSDGNLVLSDVLAGTALWSTDTGGTAAGQAIVQSDGNFVIYDAAGSALWTAGTAGNPGAYLRIQDDGNVVIYDATAQPIWSHLTGSLLP